MIRIFVILGLIFAAPLQGLARGGYDFSGDSTKSVTVALDQSAGAVLEAGDEPCCDETKLTDNKPSLCKSDCKAVIAIVSLPPYPVVHDYSGPLGMTNTSIERPVDLQPPIS